jgi:RNA polymerase sigma factor (sigma-70 family)
MSVRSAEALQQYLRRLCDQAVLPEDDLLLKRFVADNDRVAFEQLIARHGPMVLGTARRLVDDSHDAEDVFQAVFLSLARLAKTIRQGRTLPAWLHKTTCRVAAQARKNRASKSKASLPELFERHEPSAELAWQEVCQALDEELQRLPARLRSPLLLCYLSGLTRDEAARQLGWSLGTLKRRLEEGRTALRGRLERRGISAAGLALAVLSPSSLNAAVCPSLAESCVAVVFGKEVGVAAGAIALAGTIAFKGVAMKAAIVSLALVALSVGIYAGLGGAEAG